MRAERKQYYRYMVCFSEYIILYIAAAAAAAAAGTLSITIITGSSPTPRQYPLSARGHCELKKKKKYEIAICSLHAFDKILLGMTEQC